MPELWVLNPLRSTSGGVLKRAGHTEAAVDLARAAGRFPGGVVSQVVSEDKTGMARLAELGTFAEGQGLHLISIADLIRHRSRREKLVRRITGARNPTEFGDFVAHAYESELDGRQHLALVKGDVANGSNVLVRVHRECLTGDVFGSLRCDCKHRLQGAIATIAETAPGWWSICAATRAEGSDRPTHSAPKTFARRDSTPSVTDSSRTLQPIGLDGFGLDIIEQV